MALLIKKSALELLGIFVADFPGNGGAAESHTIFLERRTITAGVRGAAILRLPRCWRSFRRLSRKSRRPVPNNASRALRNVSKSSRRR